MLPLPRHGLSSYISSISLEHFSRAQSCRSIYVIFIAPGARQHEKEMFWRIICRFCVKLLNKVLGTGERVRKSSSRQKLCNDKRRYYFGRQCNDLLFAATAKVPAVVHGWSVWLRPCSFTFLWSFTKISKSSNKSHNFRKPRRPLHAFWPTFYQVPAVASHFQARSVSHLRLSWNRTKTAPLSFSTRYD